MKRIAERWNAYWFAPAPLVDLALLRIAVVGFTLAWLVGGGLRAALDAAVASPDARFAPVLLVRAISGHARPDPALASLLHALTIACGVLSLAGLWTRASTALFALGVLWLQGYVYSFGRFHHAEAALAIVLAALPFAPVGAALSVDAWRARRRDPAAARPSASPLARWPVLLARWILALVFLSAGLSKLGNAGLEWANGYTLQFCAFVKGAKLGTPFGVWLSERHELCRVLSWCVLAFETSFWLVLVRGALAKVYVPAAVVQLVAIHLTLGAAFYQLVVLCAAFVPWSRLRTPRPPRAARPPAVAWRRRPRGALVLRKEAGESR